MPQSPKQIFRRATDLLGKGQVVEAEQLYRQLLAKQPKNAELLHLIGVAALQQGRRDESIDLIRQAIVIDPAKADYHNNLAILLDTDGKRDEAIAEFRAAIGIKPDHAEAHNNLAGTLAFMGQIDEAIAEYQTAISQKPDYAAAWDNLGSTLRLVGRDNEALAAYDRAIELNPDFAYAHYNRGTLNLARGEFASGWEDFEWRWKSPGFNHPRRDYGKAMWDGGDLSGKTILLHAEQGLGDTLQFVRYAALLADRGAKVIVEAQPPLTSLLAEAPGVSVAISRGETLPEFDVHVPMLGVPRLMKTTLQTIPADVPYILPPAVAHENWRRSTGDDARADGEKKLRIGLAWAGNPDSVMDRRRSLALSQFAPLAGISNVRFYSLQVGPAAAQIASSPFPIIDHTPHLTDFVQTAGLVANLDLVICADTAVAHLAGAMNQRTWLLIYSPPDWRWMLDREDSIWYPSVRLFRQKERGQWNDPIERVAEELTRLVEKLAQKLKR